MTVAPKANRYPIIFHYNENGKPVRLAESDILSASSITATTINTVTISATSYLGAPIGGVTAIGQLADVDPNIVATPGNLLIVGIGNGISGLTSSTFAVESDLASLSSTVVILQGASGSVTGSYLPLSGGTVSGDVVVTGTLRSNTSLSAPTYLNLPSALPGEYGVLQPDGDSTHYFDGDGNWTVPPGGTGVSSFSALVDTFSNFPGRAGNIVVVSPDGSGLNTIASTVIATQASLDSHTASAVHWTRAQLNSDYINTSGDTFTGTVNGISALFTAISATNYYNVTATVGSATTTAIGGLQLNGLINTYYNGSGQWVSGVEASSILYLSGGSLTGGLSAPILSATTYQGLPSATSAVVGIALLANDNQSLTNGALRSTDTRLTLALQSTKSISLLSPSANDNFTVFYTNTGTYTITEIAGILQGGENTSATVEFLYSSVRNSAGVSVTSLALTSVTTAENATSGGFSEQSLAASTFLWFKVNSVAVTVPTELNLTIYLTRTG